MSRLITQSCLSLLLIFFAQYINAEEFSSANKGRSTISELSEGVYGLKSGNSTNHFLKSIPFFQPFKLEEGLDVTVQSVEATNGDEICLDITVANFTDVTALSFTINYDKNALEFDTVDNVQLLNVNEFNFAENFGTPTGDEPIEEGFVTVVWTSPGLRPVDYTDGTAIFQVCFTVKGNNTTTVEITGDLTPIDVIDVNEQSIMLNPTPGTITLPGGDGGGGDGGGNSDIDTEKCGKTYNGFTVIGNDVQADPGDQICVDVCVANFEDITALSMTMEYDKNVLTFDTVDNIQLLNVNEFNYPETFGTPTGAEPIEEGFVTLVWTSPGLQPVDYADGTVIFQLCFTVKGNTTATSTEIKFSSELTPIDVIDVNEQNVDFNGENGTIALGEGGNGGGGGGENPDIDTEKCGKTYNGFTVIGNDLQADPGDQICVDVCVANFEDITALSMTMEYDKNVLTFDTVDNIQLLNVNEFNYPETFGTPTGAEPIEEGFVTLVWTSPGLQPVDYADGTVIFQLCFTVKENTTATSTMVEFTGELTPIDVIDVNEQSVPFNKEDATIALGEGGNGGGGGGGENPNIDTEKCGKTYDGFTVIGNDVQAEPGDQICVDVCVANFNDITALSMTMNYDKNVLTFDTVDNIQLLNVNEFNYPETFGTPTGAEPIEEGFVTLVWTSPGLRPVDYADGTVIFQLCFTVKENTTATSTKVEFTGDLTPIDVIDVNEQSVPFNKEDATIALGEDNGGGGGGGDDKCNETYEGFHMIMADAQAQQGDNICLDVCVANFSNITALSLTMNYDKDVLEFDTVDNIQLLNVNEFNYSQTFGTPNADEPIEEGFVTLVWTSPGLRPVDYADGTVIFQVCFKVKQNTTATSTKVEFTGDLTPIDVIDVNEESVPFNGLDGTITIGDIVLPPPTIVSPAAITDVACFEESTGAINITVQGGSGSYTYAWDYQNATTQDLNNIPAGTYKVIVTDNVSTLQTEGTFTVGGPAAALKITDVDIIDVSCFGESTGAIAVVAEGGTSPYTFKWSDGLNDGTNQTGLSAGTYGFTVTDRNGCEAISTPIVVTQPASGIQIDAIVPQKIDQGNDGAVTLEVSGGSEDYSYSWTGPGNFSSTNANLNGLNTAGEYCVTVTDEGGCEAMACATVTAQLQFGEVAIGRTCNEEAGGSINLNIIGGTPGYSFRWNNGAETQNLSDLEAGTYSVTVTDAASDEVNATFEVGSYSTIGAVVNTSPVTETNGSNGRIVLTISGGTPPYSVSWNTGATGRNLSNVPVGEYCATITDQNGCTAEVCANVDLLLPLSFNTQKTDITCNGKATGAIAITVQGGIAPYTIEFADGTSFPSTDGVLIRNALGGGLYDFTVKDSRGEELPGSVMIDEPPAITLSGINVTHDNEELGCTGGISLGIEGGEPGYTVAWNSPNTGEQITGLCEGVYVPTITDANGCVVDFPGIEISTFKVQTAAITNANCPMDASGVIDLNISGGEQPYSILWRNESGEMMGEEEDLQNLTPGSYSVTVSESSGNTIEKSFTISAQSDLGIEVTVGSNYSGFAVSCQDATDGILLANGLNGSGNYNYEWTKDDAMIGTEAMLTSVGPGTYTAMVIDEFGCEVMETVTLTAPNPIEINANFKDVSCPGDANGEIVVSATGGVSSTLYTYQWSNGNIGQRNAFLGAGNYSVTVSDVNQCQMVQNFTITEPDPIAVNVETQPATDGCNGVAIANVSGGAPPYNYIWDADNAIAASMIDKLCNGLHFLKVIDSRGCTSGEDALQFSVRDRRFPCIEVREVLTPDGDGLNEKFVINCIDDFPDNSLEIYNRWGQLVYEIEGYDCTDQGGINCFIGETNIGEELPEGPYYYVLVFTDSEGKLVQRKGALSIVRE